MGQHIHLLVRAEVRKPLITPDSVVEFLRRAVALAGMNVIGGPWAVMGEIPGNEGPSGAAILDYSSTTIHLWPYRDRPLVHFDLYTCGPTPNPHDFRSLFDEMDLISFRYQLIDREAI